MLVFLTKLCRANELPMPATKSNTPALEAWIRDYFKSSALNQCKRQEWPITTGKPMKIHRKPETIPYCYKKPTLVPMNFRAQVKADIEADVKKGILERVPAGEHDTLCSRIANLHSFICLLITLQDMFC